PRLILRRPAATPLRARQELEPPETNLRVVVNVQHNYRAKPHPSGKPSTVESGAEEWPPSTAYDGIRVHDTTYCRNHPAIRATTTRSRSRAPPANPAG